MNDEWDADHCALRMPSLEYCRGPVHKSPKVAPFCSVFHRDEYRRQQNRLAEEKYVATCAGVDDLVRNNGRVCRIKVVRIDEAHDNRKPKGHRYKSGVFRTEFKTHCGESVGAQRPLKDALASCIACLAEGGT